MAETKPRAEQVRFISTKTGEHLLDEYIEQAERTGMTIGDLLDQLFDIDGHFKTDIFEFRIEDMGGGDYDFQYRVGPYIDPDAGWITISEPVFAQILTAAVAAQTASELARDQAQTARAGAETAENNSEIAAISSAASSALSQDWATKTSSPVSGGDYGAKYYSNLAAGIIAQGSGTSTTSNTVGTGSKNFTTQGGKDFAVGRHLLITSNANPDTQRMSGIVTAYNSGTGALTVNVESVIGSATRTDWTIRIDGERGAQGIQGITGNAGADGGTTLVGNTQTGSYTLVLADAGKIVHMNVAGANNLTVPTNATVAFPIGTQILIHNMGAGQTTVVASGGVTINRHSFFSLKLRGQFSMGVLIKTASDTWTLGGHLEIA